MKEIGDGGRRAAFFFARLSHAIGQLLQLPALGAGHHDSSCEVLVTGLPSFLMAHTSSAAGEYSGVLLKR